MPRSRLHPLRRRRDFRRLLSRGKVLTGRHWKLHHAPGAAEHPRFGIAVPKRLIKTAVRRNRLRRMVREVLRLECAPRIAATDCLLRLTAAGQAPSLMRDECRRLLAALPR